MSVNRTGWSLVLWLLAAPASQIWAQDRQLDPGYVGATRESLAELQSYYEAGAVSQAYSPQLRDEARSRASAVQQRLQDGDFQPGDRIVLTVADEPILNDTFVVVAGPNVDLPELGPVSLHGVLRSELTEYFTTVIGRYINNPSVRARSYVRIQVTGEVGKPGFYMLPAETAITDAIMTIGGPTATADIAKLKVYRGRQVILSGEAGELAIQRSLTLAELGIQDGDLIYVPRKSPFSPGQVGQTLLVLSGTIIALTTLFRRL